MAIWVLNIPVNFSENQLQCICDCLNERHEYDLEDDDWDNLTVAEIIAKPAVAKYIAEQLALYLEDHWNDQGLEMVAQGDLLSGLSAYR